MPTIVIVEVFMTKSQSKNPEKLQATVDQLMKAKMKATILFFCKPSDHELQITKDNFLPTKIFDSGGKCKTEVTTP